MTLINKTPSSGYIPEIDSLRAIAVLSVILFHFNPLILPGGFSGVDVFFVISGYVVSSSLAKSQHSHFIGFVLQFYSRRIIRIYPALLACLMIVGVLQTLFVPASWLSQSTNSTALYAFAGLSNFALIWFNDGYFSPRIEFNAFTHTWSLAVEEQFYLLFPFIFFIWIKYKEQKSLTGEIAHYLLPLLFIVSLIFLA
jgi:peptidoglycan/LPS O-acetylase OafA/YrhL